MTVQKFWDYYDAITSAMVTQMFTGEAPDESQIESHIAFVNNQQAYGASIGVASPLVFGFEALASAFTNATEADSKFFALNANYGGTSFTQELGFVTNMYVEVFDVSPTSGQAAHFLNQLDYFQNLYQGAGLADWNVRAHAAVTGQMLGAAVEGNFQTSDYYQAGHAFVADAQSAEGSAVPFDQNIISFYGIT